MTKKWWRSAQTRSRKGEGGAEEEDLESTEHVAWMHDNEDFVCDHLGIPTMNSFRALENARFDWVLTMRTDVIKKTTSRLHDRFKMNIFGT